jgi:hypothetical protein
MGQRMLKRYFLALAFAGLVSTANAQPVTTKPALNMLTANCALTNLLTGGAVSPGCGPTPARAGDIMFFNGTIWQSLAGNNSGTQFLQESSAGIPSWATVSGTGTVTSVTCGTGLSGGTITTSGTCALNLTNASVQTASISPTGTTSTTGVMMGLGLSGCTITPVLTGRVHFEIGGNIVNSVTALASVATLRFGTGTAPSNGGAAAGTQLGANHTSTAVAAGSPGDLNMGGIATGLTLGTPVWFDADVRVSAASTGSISVACNAFEF